MLAWTLINVIPLAVLVWLTVRMYRLFAPFWLFPRGKFVAARALFVKMSRSWFASRRYAALLNIAACDQMLGRYEDALSALRSLPYAELDRTMQYAIDTAIGSVLVSLERDHAEARERLMRAAASGRHPDILLDLAHCELSLGRENEAQLLYDEAMTVAPSGELKLGLRTGIYRSGTFVEQETNLQAGWFLARTGRVAEAIPLLEDAAAWPIHSSLNEEAKKQLALLPRSAALEDEEEAPLSTAAVVLESTYPRRR